jgi:hypothetical protein
MYMATPDGATEATGEADRRLYALDPATGLAIGVAVLATVVMGVVPGGFLNFAESAKLLF